MNRRKKVVPLVVIIIILWVSIVYLILKFSPDAYMQISNYQFLITNLFFPLVFLATSLLFALLFNHTRRGVLLGLGVTIFLILRLLKLTHPFYLIIIILTVVAFELAFRKR